MTSAGRRRRSRRAGGRAALLVAGLALLGCACGVPIDRAPNALPANELPGALSAAPATTVPPGIDPSNSNRPHVDITIFLVNGLQQLVAATRAIKPPQTLQAVLTSLANGPSSKESAGGYSTDLPAGVSLTGTSLQPHGIAVVDVGASFLAQGGETAIDEYAQVVCSLARSLTQVKAVDFTSAGVPSGALLANGQLVERPVTPADYKSLLAPGA